MDKKYFLNLNYSMANEDTNLEFQIAKRTNAKKILTVGGSGSRSLPFLALPIEELKIVDLSQQQLDFIQFKLATIKFLSQEEAISFWMSEEFEFRSKLLLARSFDQKYLDLHQIYSDLNFGSPPLYWGRWEKTFMTFSKLTKLFFSKEIRENLFTCSDPYAYYEKFIKGQRWNFLLKLVGNKAMFNSLLYKGGFIKKNSPLSYFEYYHQAFERLFKLNIKKSHFLQLCLCGKVIHHEALPIEFKKDIFEGIKKSNVTPSYQNGSVFEREENTLYDFISLSDVPSYLSGIMERNYIQELSKNVSPDGLIINRFYLRVSEATDLQGFKKIEDEFKQLIEEELVQMYQVQILRKGPA